jgi:uncharacterized protein YodC (DUF2158 family)
MLVVIALFSMLLAPALAAAIVAPTTPTAPAPVNTAAPTLTGTPALGQTLTCSLGSWANNPTGYSYAWLRSGVPIAGQAGSTYVVQAADQGHTISCQVTAANGGGNYTISGLASGSYNVSFYVGYEGGNYVGQYYNGKSLYTEATPVSVTAPNATGGIDAELHPGGQIVGRVTDAVTHGPVANIFVCANEVGEKFGGCSSTNSNGEYTIPSLPSGSYKVEFSSLFSENNYITQFYNGKPSFVEADAVAVTAGSTTAGINAELQSANQGGQISGTVIKASGGATIEGIQVCAYGTGSGFLGACASTNHNGQYTISGLAAANYKVEFLTDMCGSSGCTQQNYVFQYYNDKSSYLTADEVTVKAGETTPNIDAKLVEGGQITGRVTSASGGAPLANINVCADEGELIDNCATTNGNGEYTISGLPTGASYTVGFYRYSGNYLGQFYNGQSSTSGANPVSVTEGSITPNIDAKLMEGGQITGTVTDAATHAGLAEIGVCAYEAGGKGSAFGCTSTTAGGAYTLSALPTGTYNLQFYPENENTNYLVQTVDGVSVVAGSTTAGHNAEMHPAGQITGRVTDASTHAGLTKIYACAEEIGGGSYKCAVTNLGAASVSANSNSLSVPPGNFTMAKAPAFDSKTDNLDFFFTFPSAGMLKWSLFFKNADVGFADSLGLSLAGNEGAVAETAKKKKKSKKCKAGFIKHRGKCVHVLVPFGSGSKSVPAGTVEIKVHASSKAIKALKAGHTLHVSGQFTFQSALGGPAVTHTESAVVRLPKKHAKKHGKGKGH